MTAATAGRRPAGSARATDAALGTRGPRAGGPAYGVGVGAGRRGRGRQTTSSGDLMAAAVGHLRDLAGLAGEARGRPAGARTAGRRPTPRPRRPRRGPLSAVRTPITTASACGSWRGGLRRVYVVTGTCSRGVTEPLGSSCDRFRSCGQRRRRPAETSPLHERHVALGAKFAEFGGWSMPLEYAGVVKEHTAVREAVGVFDVSHLGKAMVRGPGAARTSTPR